MCRQLARLAVLVLVCSSQFADSHDWDIEAPESLFESELRRAQLAPDIVEVLHVERTLRNYGLWRAAQGERKYIAVVVAHALQLFRRDARLLVIGDRSSALPLVLAAQVNTSFEVSTACESCETGPVKHVGHNCGAVFALHSVSVSFQSNFTLPFAADTFDGVLSLRALDTAALDPVGLAAECFRVTRPGGHFLAVSRNSGGYGALQRILQGDSPIAVPRFAVENSQLDGNNGAETFIPVPAVGAEVGFSASELRVVTTAAGFRNIWMDSFSPYGEQASPRLMRQLLDLGLSSPHSGSLLILTATKERGYVGIDRFPKDLYATVQPAGRSESEHEELQSDIVILAEFIRVAIAHPGTTLRAQQRILHTALLDLTFRYSDEVLQGNSGLKGQSIFLLEITKALNPRRICEIGFNAGHSSSTWLLATQPGSSSTASPPTELLAMDLFLHDYGLNALALLKAVFPDRNITTVAGNSLDTVPNFTASHPDLKCDILLVDGGHEYEVALADLRNARAFATPDTLLVVDDVYARSLEPGERYEDLLVLGAWARLEDEDVIERVKCWAGEEWGVSFCVGRYRSEGWGPPTRPLPSLDIDLSPPAPNRRPVAITWPPHGAIFRYDGTADMWVTRGDAVMHAYPAADAPSRVAVTVSEPRPGQTLSVYMDNDEQPTDKITIQSVSDTEHSLFCQFLSASGAVTLRVELADDSVIAVDTIVVLPWS